MQTKALSKAKRVMLFVVRPLLMLFVLIKYLLISSDLNFIKGADVQVRGVKHNSICKPFDLRVLKMHAKANACSVNDVVLGLVSVSLRRFLRAHDDTRTHSLNILIPFSTRHMPHSLKQFKLENDFTILIFPLALRDTLVDSLAAVKAQTARLKQSVVPFGVQTLAKVVGLFPGIITQIVQYIIVGKATLVVSNIPGPLKRL